MLRSSLILIVPGLIAGVLLAGCGSRPDNVVQRFYEQLAARDVAGMSELVCEDERAEFRESVDFLRVLRDAGAVEVHDFRSRTERSDGTTITLGVSGRFVSAERGDIQTSGRVRLQREGGGWCISGERDGFRSISGIAGDLFSLLVRNGIGGDGRVGYPGSAWIRAEASMPERAGPPAIDGEVVTTQSGLRYVDVEVGTGAMPSPGQTVVVHYTMWVKGSGELIDTAGEGDPSEFVLGSGEVIAGFNEGVAMMREGGRRRLTVPWRLAYKDDYVDGFADNVPKNATLVFDVELVEVR